VVSFQLFCNSDGAVSLKALVNNMYVTAVHAGRAAADCEPDRDRCLGRVDLINHLALLTLPWCIW
jgi:hypothetical protein